MNRIPLVKHYAGSKAYGTNIETSDTDFRGIFLGHRKEISTPFFKIQEWTDESEEDTKLFELNFFIELCCENNPNIMETLFVDKSDIVLNSLQYEYLRDNRDLFLTKKIAHTTSSYAIQCLSKMKNHNKFINNTDMKEPLQTDYISVVRNFTDNKDWNKKIDLVNDFSSGYKLISYGKDIYGLIKSENKRNSPFNQEFFLNRIKIQDNTVPLILLKFKKEEYELDKIKYNSFLKWKNARNNVLSERNKIEDKFGYDTKDAMHLVRLMRVGYEYITEGVYNVKRKDAEELLSIRNGDWSYEKIYNYALEFDDKIKSAAIISNIPNQVDKEKISEIIINIQDSVWDGKLLPKLKTKKNIFKY